MKGIRIINGGPPRYASSIKTIMSAARKWKEYQRQKSLADAARAQRNTDLANARMKWSELADLKEEFRHYGYRLTFFPDATSESAFKHPFWVEWIELEHDNVLKFQVNTPMTVHDAVRRVKDVRCGFFMGLRASELSSPVADSILI